MKTLKATTKTSTDNPNELFVVVDEDDNILGHQTRTQCHQDKSLIHRAIGIVIFNQNGQILLQKRSQAKDTFPGFYTISCSGHVSRGQSYQEAAQRELKEELGIQLPLKFSKKFITREEKETEMNVLFKAESQGPFSPNQDEVDYVKFCSPEEIRNLADQAKLTPFAKRSLKEIGILK